jgi:hypothetical protein
MKQHYIKPFIDGLIGSFVIAALILLAIPRVISDYVNHKLEHHQQQ